MTEKSERITDTLSVYQEKGVFCYGTDAVLLSAYTAGKLSKSRPLCGMELCSGTGFIALSLLDRFPLLSFSALEINEHAAALSQKSAAQSALSDRFSAVCGDLCRVRTLFPSERFDFVVCNPPYMTANCGKMCAEDYKTVARHEIFCTISDVFAAAYHLLGTGGSLFLVYRPDRLASLFSGAEKNGFQIKNMTFVSSRPCSAPNLVLCEAKKQGREGLILSPPFFVYDESGEYSPEMMTVREKGEYRFGK